jgi:hypothetical protein
MVFSQYSHLSPGMDFFKHFTAHNSAASTPSMNSALTQAMSQYMMPTLDIAELDKRLNDLSTVLQFMEMNTAMLRQSLQTLELQRNAVVSFQNMMNTQTASPSVVQSSP